MTFSFYEGDLQPILYSQMLQFFNYVNRTPKCPVCPHAGIWNFHIDVENAQSSREDPVMMFFDLPALHPTRKDIEKRFMRVVALECPRCGHLEFIQAARVHQFLNKNAPEPQA